jgi:hypothetical protein
MIERRCSRYIAAAFIAALVLLAGARSTAFADENANATQSPLPGTSPEVMHFIERATGTGQAYNGQLYFAKLPANFSTEIPLPLGTSLLGSIERTNSLGKYFWLFYDIDDADAVQTVDAYEARLIDAGWTEQRPLGRPKTGFVGDYGKTFCATGRPSITVTRLNSESGRSLDITIQRTTIVGQCGNVVDLAAQPPVPLPRFVAPAGAEMSISLTMGSAQRSAESGSTLVSSAPLPALVNAFEAQLLAAHWKAVDKTVGKRTAIESFTITDSSGARWDAVLTLYASLDEANTYYAGMTALMRSFGRRTISR